MNVEHIAEGLTAVALVAGGARWAWPRWRKFGHFLDDALGEPARPGAPARPGWAERLSNIEAEFQPDHGGSMRDAVDRVEAALTAHLTDPQAHGRKTS